MYHDIYNLSKIVALAGWAIIFASLFLKAIRSWGLPVAQFVLPAVLSIMYLMMVWAGRHDLHLPHSFTDLEGIHDLYQNRSALTASWLHFLAFDMFAGAWMVRDGATRGIPLLLILFCLPFTFIFGPLGLLLYIIIRFATGHRSVASTDD